MIQNAIIRGTNLGFHDGVGSIPTAQIHLTYGDGAAQSFGGYQLKGGYTHYFVYGILATLKVDGWERLNGTAVRVDIQDGMIRRIGHYMEDRWFDPLGSS